MFCDKTTLFYHKHLQKVKNFSIMKVLKDPLVHSLPINAGVLAYIAIGISVTYCNVHFPFIMCIYYLARGSFFQH